MTLFSASQLMKIRNALVNTVYAYCYTDYLEKNVVFTGEEIQEVVNVAFERYKEDERFKDCILSLTRSIQRILTEDN